MRFAGTGGFITDGIESLLKGISPAFRREKAARDVRAGSRQDQKRAIAAVGISRQTLFDILSEKQR